MKLIGHETPSILDRYTILDEDWLSEEAGKVDGVLSATPKRKVRGL
jgi:hypothetical protein